jgi:hypothetical protein
MRAPARRCVLYARWGKTMVDGVRQRRHRHQSRTGQLPTRPALAQPHIAIQGFGHNDFFISLLRNAAGQPKQAVPIAATIN